MFAEIVVRNTALPFCFIEPSFQPVHLYFSTRFVTNQYTSRRLVACATTQRSFHAHRRFSKHAQQTDVESG